MRTVYYKIGIGGEIDDTAQYPTLGQALEAAHTLSYKSDGVEDVSVYGYQEYTEDDPTPVYARTYFWTECKIDVYGRVRHAGIHYLSL